MIPTQKEGMPSWLGIIQAHNKLASLKFSLSENTNGVGM